MPDHAHCCSLMAWCILASRKAICGAEDGGPSELRFVRAVTCCWSATDSGKFIKDTHATF